MTGRACAGWGGLGQDAVRASDGSFKARGKERGKSARSIARALAPLRGRGFAAIPSPRPAGSAGRCARTRTRPRADRLRASARARARPAPGGALKKYIRIRAWRRDTWQTTKWKARMGRVPVGSRRGARPEGAGSDGAVSFASSCARAGSARACASRGVLRVGRGPALQSWRKNISLFVRFRSHMANSLHIRTSKSLRETFFPVFKHLRELRGWPSIVKKKRIKGLLIGFPSDFIDRALHSWGELIGSCFTRGFCRGF